MSDDIKATLERELAGYPVSLEPTEVAEILGVSRRYVDKLLDDGKLQHFVLDETKTQKQKRVLKAVLIAYMIQQQTQTTNQI